MPGFSNMKHTIMLLVALLAFAGAQAQEYSCPEELFAAQDAKTKLYGYRTITREWRIPASFQGALPFDGVNAVVMQNKRVGVIDCKGYFALPPRFDDIKEFYFGRGWAKQNGKWGLYDNQNRNLQAHLYEEVRPSAPRHPLTWVRQDGKWGVINKDQNRIVIQPAYEAYNVLSDTAALVRRAGAYRIIDYVSGAVLEDSLDYVVKEDAGLVAFVRNGRWGVVNKRGTVVVPARFDSTYSRGSLAVVRQGGKLGAWSRGRQILAPTFDEIEALADGLVPVRSGSTWRYYSAKTGQPASAKSFEQAGPFRQGRAIVKTSRGWGLLTSDFAMILPDTNRFIGFAGGTFYAIYPGAKGKLKLLNLNLQTILAPPIDSIWLGDPITATRVRHEGQVKLMNIQHGLQAMRLLPGKGFDMIQKPLANGLYPVVIGQRTGLADMRGNVIIQPAYDSLSLLNYGGQDFYILHQGGKQGAANNRGQVLLPVLYEQVLPAPPNHFKIKQNGLWGLASQNGKHTVEPQYADMQGHEPGVPALPAVVQKKDRWGAIDATGQEVMPFKYQQLRAVGQGFYLARTGKDPAQLIRQEGSAIGSEKIEEAGVFGENYLPVQVGGRWGYMGTAGKLIIPAKYEQALTFKNGAAPVKENGRWGIIDRQGNYTVPPRFRRLEMDSDGGRRLGW